MVIEFDDEEIGAKTVEEILANPPRYLGETASDPLAGVEYGRCKCLVMQDERDGYLFLHSFAHGGSIYRLLPGYAEIEKALESAAANRVAEVYAALTSTPTTSFQSAIKPSFAKGQRSAPAARSAFGT